MRRDWEDIVLFSRHLIESRDQDPIYPILREVSDLRSYDTDSALWLTILYQAFYNLPSGLAALERLGDFHTLGARKLLDSDPMLKALPTGVERRGLRGGLVSVYLAALWETVVTSQRDSRSLLAWITRGWGSNEYVNYALFQRQWQSLPYNGRWSSFKMAEILKVTHGLHIAAPDMDLGQATGPRDGLLYLLDLETASTERLDRDAAWFKNTLSLALRLPLDWETVETILCNWNSTRRGKYYVGHDIDELQAQIEHASFLSDHDRADLWQARASVLPDEYLGEKHGWSGVQRDRQREWLDKRRIVLRP